MSWYVCLIFVIIIGGPADGKLVPGDQLFKINNIAVDDLSTEQAADIIRYATCKSVCETTKSAVSGLPDVQFYQIFRSFSRTQCIFGTNGTSADSSFLYH